MESYGLFPEEQKGYHKRLKGTSDLYIYQHILKVTKTWWKNVAIAWINYKKASDIIP